MTLDTNLLQYFCNQHFSANVSQIIWIFIQH